jgi:phosphohistidine phosphatase
MSKTLMLLRHAKSSWKDPGCSDHDRPLNKRGKQAAPRMGQLLRQRKIVPDRVISSTAVRARATAQAVAEASGYEGKVQLSPELYLAAPASYIDVLRSIGGDPQRVLAVGHNPGIESLLAHLTGQELAMPTAALAVISVAIEGWDELSVHAAGELVGFWRPKQLD